MSLTADEQAVLLLTNRLLLDWISIAVDSGQFAPDDARRLIDFSTQEVVRGAPWLSAEAQAFSEVFKSRLPAAPAHSTQSSPISR